MNPFTPARSAAAALLLLALTFLLAWQVVSLRADPGIESLIPARGGDTGRLAEFNRRFGADEVIVLALRSDRLFTREGLAWIDDLTRRAASLPHVSRVVSPTNLRDLDGDELGPFESVPYEMVRSGRMAPSELGRRLAAHRLFGGLLVATDARAAALLIEVDRGVAGTDYRAQAVRGARDLVEGPPDGIEAYVAGMPVEKVDVAAYVEREQLIFAPVIFAMLAIIMTFLYRHAAGVIVPLTIVGGSLIWTLGLYGLAGRRLNPVTSLLTPVVLVVSVQGAVHLMNHHLAGRAGGLGRIPALLRAIRLSWAPCFTAALTTAIGFASLVLMPIPAIRDFGLFSAAGVMISWILTMTVAPLLLAWLPDCPERVADGFRPGNLEAALKAISGWVCRHPARAAAASALVLVLAAFGVTRIRVETDLIGSLRPSSPLHRATSFIDAHLTGVNGLEIVIPDTAPGDPWVMRRVERLESDVRALPGVKKVTGLPDFYARAGRAFHGGDDAHERLPEGDEAAADLQDYLDLLRREAPADLARFVSTEQGRTALRLEARVTAMSTATSQDLFARIREAASRAGLDVELTGSFVALSNMSTTLVHNQLAGLIPALALILAALAVQFRSVGLGLLSAIPHGAPVLMVYGLMGWVGIPLSVPTAMIANITLGMTDDNTIHLLTRFREELRSGSGYVKALEIMFDTSGRAVVSSTLILTLGFWVGTFSSFLPSVHFAALTGAALLLGLASETVLLPLTMILFKPLGNPAAKGRAVAGALLVLLAVSQSGTAANAATHDAILKDQHGKPDSPALHRGRMVVLIYGRAPGLRRMKAWELKLKEETAAADSAYDVVRALDARDVKGKKTEEEVGRRLRRFVPDDISILIDWDGDLMKEYALPAADVTVTIIDPKGRSCGSTAGPVTDDSLRRTLGVITRVKQKGSCP